MSRTEYPLRQSIFGGLPGALAALVLFALAEAVLTVTGQPSPPAAALPGLVVVALGTLHVLWVPFVYAVVVDVLQVPFARSGTKIRIGLTTLVLGLSAGFSAHWYSVLTEYEPFQGYLPFQAGLVASTLGLTVHWWLNTLHREEGLLKRVPLAVNILMILAGVGVHVANYLVYRGLYPTMHHAALLVAAVLIIRGFSAPAQRAPRRKDTDLFAAMALLLIVLSGIAARADVGREARPYLYHTSELGRVASMQQELALADGSSSAAGAVRPDASALVRFEAASKLPALPESFRLEDYNVLVIASEATRYDKTSFPAEGPDTTPSIVEAAKRGWVAHRAYSPSSGTLHSVSALFTMKYPSAIDLVTWMQPWFGELSQSETTVAELFSEAGYQTFWLGHDHNIVLSRSILGLNQGFEETILVPEYSRPHPRTTDRKVAARARKKLTELAKKPDDRFFGFIFFVSPHGPYITHGFEDLPSKTNADKYLHEVRNVDRHFKTVFDTLEETDLLDNTVVVYLSDHGEEFREHGGVRHKSTVYSESIRVPFVLWVPGLEPGSTAQPLSTLYLFPWLLTHAESQVLREPAVEVLENLIGPVLRETNNAVVSELVGHDRIKTTLVWEQYKLNYDYRSRLYELYDVTVDPLEQKNIFQATDTGQLEQHFEQFDRIRAATKKYSFLPKKKAPSIGQWRKMQREKKKRQKKR